MSNGPDDNELDFDTLWNADSETAKPEEAPADTSEAQEQQESPATPPIEASEESGGAEAATETSEGSGEPETKPAAASTPEYEWLAEAPATVQERVKQELKQAEDRLKALQGRLAPTQRALSDAQLRLNQLTQQQQQQQQAAASAPQIKEGQSDSDYFDSDEFKAWAEDYPGDAKILRGAVKAQQRGQQEAIKQLQSTVEQLQGRLAQTEQVTSRTHLESLQEEEQRLEAAHPDWRELNDSDEFWEYADQWRASQPKAMRDVLYDQKRWEAMWSEADFVAARLSEYKATKAPPAQPAATPPAQAQIESTQTPPAQPAANARLAMSVAPDVKGHGQSPRGVPLAALSPEEQFDHLWKTIEP